MRLNQTTEQIKEMVDAKMFAQIKKKYFKDKSTDENMRVLEQALEIWFVEKTMFLSVM